MAYGLKASSCDPLKNYIVKFYVIGSHLEISTILKIWADYNFATKAFLQLWSMNLLLNYFRTYSQKKKKKKPHGIWLAFLLTVTLILKQDLFWSCVSGKSQRNKVQELHNNYYY